METEQTPVIAPRTPVVTEETGEIITGLATLPPKTLVDSKALANLLGVKSVKTIARMVDRGELPPPIEFGGRSRWVVDGILKHIEAEATKKAEEAAKWRAAHAPAKPSIAV